MYRLEDAQPGDFIACYAQGWAGKAISAITGGPYSHIAIVGNGCLIEALEHVSKSPVGKYEATGDLFSLPFSPDEKKVMLKAAESRVGQFYGWQMAADDLGRLVFHIPIIARWNPRVLDCSGLLVWSAAQAGKWITYAPAPTPMDVVNSGIPIGKRPWMNNTRNSTRESAYLFMEG